MGSRIIIALMILVAGGVGFLAGSREGHRRVHDHVIRQEFGWTYHTLNEGNPSPQLREYLKAKLYYYSMSVPEERLRRYPLADHGPVSADTLGDVRPVPPKTEHPTEYYP